ncbi:MAG: GTPase HflX [Candidatus Methanomethylicota archaeon]|nr:MAG: GTPase HflX [Candidatus Verstraetearchaeota archaeon]
MKAVLVECLVNGEKTKIKELEALAKSRGYQVVANIMQRRRKPDPAYYIGRGKLMELKEIVEKTGAENVIFSNTLKASQAFRIRRELGWRANVIDRNLLILEIFEERARTAEAKLQIELARLYYMLPWTREYVRFRNLYGEQVGWGALGEYLHRVYEQHIRKRIARVEEKLEKIRMKNVSRIIKRHELGLPEVTLTGYTQAGKTELFNRLAMENKPTGLGPFTTLSTYARRMKLKGRGDIILTDSIGFIEDMHPLILEAFYATLHELVLADLIILVVDASEENSELKRKIDASEEILRKVAPATPKIVALNKIDLIDDLRIKKAEKIAKEYFPYDQIIPVSAKYGYNLEKLVEAVRKEIKYEYV